MEWCSLLLLAGFVLVRADYQFELDMLEYRNPGRKTFRDQCCEIRTLDTRTGNCITDDTCDPRFAISLINFDIAAMPMLGTNYVLGTFMNADSISFDGCSTIESDRASAGVQNPLKFVFPSTQFTPGQTLRATMDITHTEGGRNIPIVANFVQQFDAIPGTNAAFSSNMTFFATAPATLLVRLRYRLICTPGTCGSDCSQTSACPGFPQACVPDCNVTVPCLNGGICKDRRCNCTPSYQGLRCEVAVTTTTVTPTTVTTPTVATTRTLATTSDETTDSPTEAATLATDKSTTVSPSTSSATKTVSPTNRPRDTELKTSGAGAGGLVPSSAILLCLFIAMLH